MNWKYWLYQFFLTGQPFTSSLFLSLILAWRCLEGTSQFYVRTSLIVVRNYLRDTGDKCFPRGLSLGGIPDVYSDCTPGGIGGKQGFNGEGLDISLECHQVVPGASPPRFGRTRGDKYSCCISKGQTKSDQGRKALV